MKDICSQKQLPLVGDLISATSCDRKGCALETSEKTLVAGIHIALDSRARGLLPLTQSFKSYRIDRFAFSTLYVV